MLAGDRSPGRPGSGCLAPVGGLFLCLVLRPLPCASGLRHPGHCRPRFLVSQSSVARLLCVPAKAAHGGFHLGAPGAESQRFSARCTCSFHRSWLAAHFCSFSLAACALGFLMSRGDELRQLAAQLSVLAALEDSIAVGLSRVMGPASPGRGAVPPDTGSPLAPAALAAAAVPAAVSSPSHEVAASLLRSASLRAASPRTRTRSRSPAPLPKRAPRAPRRSSSVASGLRGSVALAESGLVTGLATKSCPPVPPPQLRLSRVSRALHAASTGSQPSADVSGPSAPSAPASEAPRATESASNSDDEWDALLDAHGLAPSLGGTATAVAQPADAAGASRRARDKRRRRQRKAAKRSMWRDI